MDLHVVPILLGGGARLLEDLGGVELEQVRAVEAPGVTHLKYRVAELSAPSSARRATGRRARPVAGR